MAFNVWIYRVGTYYIVIVNGIYEACCMLWVSIWFYSGGKDKHKYILIEPNTFRTSYIKAPFYIRTGQSINKAVYKYLQGIIYNIRKYICK